MDMKKFVESLFEVEIEELEFALKNRRLERVELVDLWPHEEDLLKEGKLIRAIKSVRSRTGCGLKCAKHSCDATGLYQPHVQTVPVSTEQKPYLPENDNEVMLTIEEKDNIEDNFVCVAASSISKRLDCPYDRAHRIAESYKKRSGLS